ncbi:hypothetical protein ATEIFO6365_0001109500 [Aspergillus terreus]|uniref:Clr5 domain-containing protein n=1 Tax=Aspergillus terreus TaxID=33178 RepID=A0A5M3YPX3_ASPTE|nr:hypothetical protein ATETN484_0001101600 [Aspergillus terreus]GFF12871.1 hypothetical protein ATEIFO6365_0001109500 [Aspergillus terreus]
MKNSIPADVWERKKALIAKLYKDEEWPLKQVIKQIRSPDFNPSETQLRSRLKKWRVTKPSRQTRKKSNASQEPTEDDSSTESTSPQCAASVSPKCQPRSEPSRKGTLSVTTPDWYFDGVYTKQGDLSSIPFDEPGHSAWIEPHTPLTPGHDHPSTSSPSMLVIPGPASSPYDPSNTSPLDNVLVNQGAAVTQFPNPSYIATTESCLQMPTTTAAAPVTQIPWSMPQWFPLPPETQPSTVPFYPAAPLSPPIDSAMQMMPHPQRLYSSHSSQSGFSPQQMAEMYEASKRKMTSPFLSDHAAGGDPTGDKSYRPAHLERTSSLPCKMSGPPSVGLGNPSPPYFHSGPHPMMCAPMYSYPGPEPVMQGPPSIGL